MKVYNEILSFLEVQLIERGSFFKWSVNFMKFNNRLDKFKHLLLKFQTAETYQSIEESPGDPWVNRTDFFERLNSFEQDFQAKLGMIHDCIHAFYESQELSIEASKLVVKGCVDKDDIYYFILQEDQLRVEDFIDFKYSRNNKLIDELYCRIDIHLYTLHQEIVDTIFWINLFDVINTRFCQSLIFNPSYFICFSDSLINKHQKVFTSDAGSQFFEKFLREVDFTKKSSGHKVLSFLLKKMKEDEIIHKSISASKFSSYAKKYTGYQHSQLKTQAYTNYDDLEKKYEKIKGSFPSLSTPKFFKEAMDKVSK